MCWQRGPVSEGLGVSKTAAVITDAVISFNMDETGNGQSSVQQIVMDNERGGSFDMDETVAGCPGEWDYGCRGFKATSIPA